MMRIVIVGMALVLSSCEGTEPPPPMFAPSSAETQTGDPNIETRKQKDSACSQGDLDSCADFSNMLRDGEGGAKDEVRALGIVNDSCAKGHQRSCSIASHAYIKGIGTEKSIDKGLEFARSACEAKYLGGCMNVREALLTQSPDSPELIAVADKIIAVALSDCSSGNDNACKVGASFTSGFWGNNFDGISEAVLVVDKYCNAGDSGSCTISKYLKMAIENLNCIETKFSDMKGSDVAVLSPSAQAAAVCMKNLVDLKVHAAIIYPELLSNFTKLGQMFETVPPKSTKPVFEKPEYSGAIRINGTLKSQYDGGLLGRDGLVVTQGGKLLVVLGAEVINTSIFSFFTDRINGYATPTGKTIRLALGRDGRDADEYEVSDKETYQDDQKAYKETVKVARDAFNEEIAQYNSEVKARKEVIERNKTALKEFKKIVAAMSPQVQAMLPKKNHQ